jgi:hypothetical protein
MSVHYKRCLIDPKINKLRGIEGFAVSEIWVFNPRDYTDNRFFMVRPIFQTHAEALEAAMQAGRQAVDCYFS